MAYKFQLGAFTASGSIKAEEGFDANNADVNNVDTGSFAFVSSSGDIVANGIMLADASGIVTGVLADSNGQIELQLASDGGLQEADSELEIKLPAGSGLATDSNGLKVDAGGVTNAMLSGAIDQAKLAGSIPDAKLNQITTSDKVAGSAVQLSGSSLTSDAGGLKINAGGVSNAMLGGSINPNKVTVASANIIVGNGSAVGAAVAMSGDIAIDNAGETTIQAGAVENAMLAGSITANKMNGAIFADLETLGAASSDGEFIVATGAGAFAYESGNTARTSLGLGTTDSPTFAGLTVNGDLFVSGSTTTIETTNLIIEDALIRVASGSGNIAAAVTAGAGFEIGNDVASFKLNTDIDGSGLDGFASSMPISASQFVGDGSSLTGITADGVAYSVASKADGNTLEADKYNYFADLSADATVTMPASAASLLGKSIFVKAGDLTSGATITINTAADDQKIDGQDSIILESGYAAVRLVYVASDDWRVF